MNVTVSQQPPEHQPLADRVLRYLPLIVWLAFMSYASTMAFSSANTSRFIGPFLTWLFPDITPEAIAVVHVVVRKACHLGEYAVLGILSWRAFRGSSHATLRRHWFLAALLLIIVYALLDEYHQSFVPSRTASIVDSLIDTVGGVAALIFLYRRRKAG